MKNLSAEIFLVSLIICTHFPNCLYASQRILGNGSSTLYSRACRPSAYQTDEAKKAAIDDAKEKCGSDVSIDSEWKISGQPGCWDEGTIYAEAYFLYT